MRTLGLLLALSLVACDSGPLSNEAPVEGDGISLTASRDAYDASDEARVVLRNDSPVTVETGACAGLERWTGTAWEPVERDEVCIAIAFTLSPGQRIEKSVRLRVPDGSYRVVDTVSVPGREARVRVATAAFRVD